jgi:uncharacterized protein YecT (DUF1311 family)
MERTSFVGRVRLQDLMIGILASMLFSPATAIGADGRLVALEIRDNVVRLAAHVSSETTNWGFGFITAESDGKIYIVTADHVLHGSGPDEVDKAPSITFYRDQGKQYIGELLTELDPNHGDVALVRVARPEGVQWQSNVLAGKMPEPTGNVWYVGRLGKWDVPPRPGAIDEIEADGRIQVDGLNVQVGTSGAPALSEYGIFGMIVSDTGGAYTIVTPIDLIMRQVQNWNYPWQLAKLSDVTETPVNNQPVSPLSSPPPWCRNKLNSAEKLICQESTFWNLDSQLNSAFVDALSRRADDVAATKLLRAEEQAWLNARNACADYGEQVRGCILRLYQGRIGDLERE